MNTVNHVLGDGEQFAEIKSIINDSFNNGSNLSQITRIFVRELFKDEGLLIIDGDDPELKGLLEKLLKRSLQRIAHTNQARVILKSLGLNIKFK